jgi:hypothetical protein
MPAVVAFRMAAAGELAHALLMRGPGRLANHASGWVGAISGTLLLVDVDKSAGEFMLFVVRSPVQDASVSVKAMIAKVRIC